MVRSKALALADTLSHTGPEQSVDLDNAGMRLALDVVALVMPRTSLRLLIRDVLASQNSAKYLIGE